MRWIKARIYPGTKEIFIQASGIEAIRTGTDGDEPYTMVDLRSGKMIRVMNTMDELLDQFK